MREFLPWLVVVAACGSSPTEIERTFDPCAPTAVAAPDATAQQLASLDDALAMWRARGVTGLSHEEPAAVAIVFRDAASSVYGFYDDSTATVYVNERLDDASQRAIAIAHELGHALGLVHVEAALRPSVMNPGNLTISPTVDDELELARLWGACDPPP